MTEIKENMSDANRLAYALEKLQEMQERHTQAAEMLERLQYMTSWYEHVFADAQRLVVSIYYNNDAPHVVREHVEKLALGLVAARASVGEMGGPLPPARFNLTALDLQREPIPRRS